VPRVTGAFSARTALRQTLAVTRNTLAEITATRWFAVVLTACVGMPLLWGWNVGDTVFDTSTWPVTFLVTEVALAQRSALLFVILVILFAGELVWKDRDVGVAEITDAAPLSDVAALVGRFLALVALILIFQTGATTAGVLIQILQGYSQIEPMLYLRVLFGIKLADYVLLGAMAMTIHLVVNHKTFGHMVTLMVFIFAKTGGAFLRLEHNLLLYGGDPGWTYSDMNGFGPFVAPIVWFRMYWGAWALLLLVLAVAVRVRGRERGVRVRLLQARARVARPLVMRTGAVAAALVVATGGFIFFNTNVLNADRTSKSTGATQAAYERRFAQYRDLAQPTITDANLRVEIYPEQSAFEVHGRYELLNRTATAIRAVHVYVDPKTSVRAMSLDRAAATTASDEEVGYRIFELAQPLNPGESVQMAFDVGYRRRGFPNSGISTAVVENGTILDRRWLPFVGYQPMFELTDEDVRKRWGLGPRASLPRPAEAGGRKYRQPWRDADLVRADIVVGTTADQIAVAPGLLRREWAERGRRYFHYATERPESFGAVITSARYAVVSGEWTAPAGRDSEAPEPVAISVLHHPGHRYNLETFTRAATASLDYLTAQFGPYPYRELRIAEVPRYDSYGRAHPYLIEFTENFFLTRPREGEFDQVFFGVAHEIAHTWWGGQVRSAADVGGGQGFVGEALANYSAIMVAEQTFGADAARKVYEYQLNRYLSRRAELARDVPLLEATDQAYISYGKGAVTMYVLRRHLGEERLHAALRRFLAKHGAGQPPYPTSYDLYAELRAATPESLHPLLTDLFETVTLWDLRAVRATVEPLAAGRYQLTIDVAAKKVRADDVGHETEMPMDDLVHVAVFGRDGAEAIDVRPHRIRSGSQTIRVVVSRAPFRVAVDPNREFIERDVSDNILGVSADATPR
jgi:ABC-2 type transport system permease protein